MDNLKSRFALYMCFETHEEKEDEIHQSFALLRNRAQVEQWKKEQSDIASSTSESTSAAEELESTEETVDIEHTSSPSTDLAKLMSQFQETMSSYRPLVEVGIIMMPAIRSHFIFDRMYKNAGRHYEMVDKDQRFEIYGVTEEQYPSVMPQVRRLREFDKGVTVLPGAILLSLVATFDSFIADTVRLMLRHKPERVIESSKTISVKEVLNMSSFEDVRNKVIDDEVETLMRGSHDEQIKYIENKLNIDIRSKYDGWGNFIEIFERRNLIAHGNYIINSHYIRNCNKHGFEVDEKQAGERLSLDRRYLRSSSGRLLEFGLSLMFVLWLKHFADDRETAYESLNARTYELIKDGQSRVAAKLLDLALFEQTPKASDRVKKMMTVNLANAYKKLKDDPRALEVIKGVDWSAATDDFQICVAAIKEDVDRVVELMPRVTQGDLIKKSDFREWPVFDWVREEKSVQDKFQEIFGEPIIDPIDEEKTEDQTATNVLNEPETPTLH